MTSVKGRNFVANLPKMMCNNRNLDLVNVNVYTNLVKFYDHQTYVFIVEINTGKCL